MTKQEKTEAEKLRIASMFEYQAEITEHAEIVFGIDEAGRGPLCGPVVAGCCILPRSCDILYLNDSKKLSEKKREALYDEIISKAIAYGLGSASEERIDEINILNATYEAMRDAFSRCLSMYRERYGKAEYGASAGIGEKKIPEKAETVLSDIIPVHDDTILLIDGNRTVPGISYKQKAVVSGDAKCPSISAASILAKVSRDRLLSEYDKLYPEYGFAKHKGYGTKQHMDAIRKYGILHIHRRTFLKSL